MEIHAKTISNDNELTPEFKGLYGARFYSDTDPKDHLNKVIKIFTANTIFNVSSTTNIEGHAICPSPCSFEFEMRYYFESVWYYSDKYFRIEFCNKANTSGFALAFNVAEGESNIHAEKLSLTLAGDDSMEKISLYKDRWYSFKFEYYRDINTKESRLKIFIGEEGAPLTLMRDLPIRVKTDIPTRALLIHSATKIKGIQYLDDIAFTLTDNKYSPSDMPAATPRSAKKIYDFEDGIPSERNFFVEMRLKKFDDFLTMDPAAWNTAINPQIRHAHDFYEVMLVQTGEAIFVDEVCEYPLFEGSIVIVPPGIKHRIISEHKYNIISISGSFDQLSRFDEPSVLHDNIYGEGKKLAELALYNRFGSEEYFSSLCDTFLRFVLLNLDYPKSEMAAIVYRMIDMMKKNYDNSELSVIQMLRDSGYAKDYVRTKFFEVTKMTPKKYLTTIRMKKAKELLSLYGDNASISKIAEQVGIVDPAVFSKNFKQFYGMSPKQFIKGQKDKKV
ncbi:MAG: helix-turn-helix transcriptional regulator [Clostridia bacterium]|nr:helix-turn-helix transcriptional regulator [Clostridia bacterium]